MKNKIYILIIIVLAVLSTRSKAQHDGYSSITYAVSFPLGDTKDFADGVSWRGLGFDYAKFLGAGESTSVGFTAAWVVFNEKKPSETTIKDNLAVNGTQFRYLNSFPLLVVGRKYFGSEAVKNFVGLGVGTIHNQQRLEVGTFAFEDNQWHFALAPEVGVKFRISYDIYWDLFARYNYSFKAGTIDAQSYITLQTGISWMF